MKITFALALGKKNNATVIVDSNKYQTQMTESGNFTDAASIAQIAATKTATVDLVEEMNKPISEDKDAKVQVARDVLDYELDNLKSIASKKSNNPSLPEDQREAIAKSTGMSYTKRGGSHKLTFTVNNGTTSGTMRITMPAGAASYLVVYTKDIINYKERSEPITSTTAKVDIENLEKDTRYAFFYKAVYPKKKTDWIGPITKMVL